MKESESSATAKRHAQSVRETADHTIDFSDIAESTDEELARATRVGRPMAIGDSAEMEQLIE